MYLNEAGPSGCSTGATPKAVTQVKFYHTRRGEQARRDFKLAERRLCAAGWCDPVQLACDSDRMGLHESDFEDRLCGVVIEFLRDCGESGRTRTLAGAEAVLDAFAVPRDADELYFILIETPIAKGDDFADLIGDVLHEADNRSEQLCRELCRNALKMFADIREFRHLRELALIQRVNRLTASHRGTRRETAKARRPGYV